MLLASPQFFELTSMGAYVNTIYFSCGLATLFLGAVSLFQSPKSRIHQTLFFFTVGVVLWMVMLYSGFLFTFSENIPAANIFFRASFAAGPIFTFFLTRFFYIFPTKQFPYPRFVEFLFVAITLFFVMVSFATPLVYDSVLIYEDGSLGDAFGPLYNSLVVYYLINNLLQVFFGIRKLRHTTGIEKQKMGFAFSGLLLFLIPAILTNLILPLFGIIIFQVEAVSFSLFFIIPTLYAIYKYRFFNLSNAFLNLFRIGVILVFSVATILIANAVLENLNFTSTLLREILSSGAGLFVFAMLYRKFPELLTKESRAFRNTMFDLRTEMYSCSQYPDLQNLFDRYFELRLNIPHAKIFLVRSTPVNTNIPTYIRDAFTREMTKKKGIILTQELTNDSTEVAATLRKGLGRLEAGLCMPFSVEGKLIAFFILGKKRKNEIYSNEEIQMLSSLGMVMQRIFLNILIQEDLQEERDMLKSIVTKKTEDLRKLISQQADFMALSAHELRSPLTLALFKVREILDEHKLHGIDAKLLSELKKVDKALTELGGLTHQLFEVQQYDLGKITSNMKPHSIQKFLQKTCQEFAPVLRKKGLKFSFQDTTKRSLLVNFDMEKIRQVLHNLITNAAKFTPSGAAITVRCEAKKGTVKISIIDTGKGVPSDQQEKLFEKFQTAHPAMGMGIGLGLYLCRSIIALHKGEIGYSETKGGGATFFFTLPA